MREMPRIKSYSAGVRRDIELVPGPVQHILADTVTKWSDRPVIAFMGKRLSYRQLGAHIDRAGQA